MERGTQIQMKQTGKELQKLAANRLVQAWLDAASSAAGPDADAVRQVLAPITDGRWSCVHWGSAVPPFYPDEPAAAGSTESVADPMG